MEKLLLTRKEAANALSISVDTLDTLSCNGQIEHLCIGTRCYYTPQALAAFVGKLCTRKYICTWEDLNKNA